MAKKKEKKNFATLSLLHNNKKVDINKYKIHVFVVSVDNSDDDDFNDDARRVLSSSSSSPAAATKQEIEAFFFFFFDGK